MLRLAVALLATTVLVAGRGKLEWKEARVVAATSTRIDDVAAGPAGGSVKDEVDLDVGDAVLVMTRTVVRTASWRPEPNLQVFYAVDGKKVFVKGPWKGKPIELKLQGRYPKKEPPLQ